MLMSCSDMLKVPASRKRGRREGAIDAMTREERRAN